MDIKKFIESGILEEYCLGLLNEEEQSFVIQMSMLYPEVKQELVAIELSMEKLAEQNAISPDVELKQKILSTLGFSDTEAPLDINNLPFTDKNSKHHEWLSALGHLIPADPTEDFLMHVLRQDQLAAQMLVITKNDVPEETHDDRMESFFILKGTCVCFVDDRIYRLTPGDFLEIPLYANHDVKIISPYVVAILQHRYL